ncbi:MAG: hypothetical protein Tsb004_15190 [Allomuricauda sp.]
MKAHKIFQQISLCSLIILSFSCNNDETINEHPTNYDLLTNLQRDFVNEYIFSTFNLSPTSNGNSLSTKWQNEIRVFVEGEIPIDFQLRIEDYFEELNRLITDGTTILIVDELNQSNVHLMLGPPSSIKQIWPDMYNLVVDTSFEGYALYDWNYSNYINSGRIWLGRPNTGLFIHELGHILGLGHASNSYCGAGDISFMCTTAKAEKLNSFDKEIITALYQPDALVGLSQTEMRNLIEEYVLINSILD